jgi:hypothetical protein
VGLLNPLVPLVVVDGRKPLVLVQQVEEIRQPDATAIGRKFVPGKKEEAPLRCFVETKTVQNFKDLSKGIVYIVFEAFYIGESTGIYDNFLPHQGCLTLFIDLIINNSVLK